MMGVALLAITLEPLAGAQEREIDPESTTRITLGGSAAQPGETALVPVYLTPPRAVTVGRVKFSVTFVSVNVGFEKVEPGPLSDPATVRFSAQVASGKNETGAETSTVTIAAELVNPKQGSLPSGLLGYLTLRLSENAQPAKITLRASAAEGAQAGSEAPLADVRAFDAILEVQVPGYTPTAVCFFFSH